MILDKYLQLASAQAVTNSAATTDYIDTVAVGQMIDPVTIVVSVDTTFTSTAADSTLVFTLQTDDETTFNSATTVATLASKAEAVLTDGAQFFLDFPKTGLERYIRGYYTVAGTDNFTTGAISVNVVCDEDLNTIG